MKTQDGLNRTQQVIEHLRRFPQDSYKEVAALYAVSGGLVSRAAKAVGLPSRHVRKPQPATLAVPKIETEAQITTEIEERKRRVAEENRRISELQEKLDASVFRYAGDSDSGMFVIRQGGTEVKAHYRFWFAFFNNGEPAKARAAMTDAFCRHKDVV